MALRAITGVCALLLASGCLLLAQELPPAPQPQANAGQQTSNSQASDTSSSKPGSGEAQQAPDNQQSPQNTDKKQPSRLKRVIDRAKPNCANVEGRQTCWDKDGRDKDTDQNQTAKTQAPKNQPVPRSSPPEGQSSSRDTQIDLSPPPDDMMHEGADVTGVTEFHAYDPHKAAKNVEVGDYYYKKANYKAAESRYAEALEWKPNDAVATFKLAQSQEKLGNKNDAVKNYEAYLKILPQGEFAGEAKSGIARLSK